MTSVGQHHILGPITLALIRRGTDDDVDLQAGGIAASQEPIVNREGEGEGRPDQVDRASLRRPAGGMPNLTRGK